MAEQTQALTLKTKTTGPSIVFCFYKFGDRKHGKHGSRHGQKCRFHSTSIISVIKRPALINKFNFRTKVRFIGFSTATIRRLKISSPHELSARAMFPVTCIKYFNWGIYKQKRCQQMFAAPSVAGWAKNASIKLLTVVYCRLPGGRPEKFIKTACKWETAPKKRGARSPGEGQTCCNARSGPGFYIP